LLSLSPLWDRYDTLLVAPDTALARSVRDIAWIAIPDVALGQIKKNPLACFRFLKGFLSGLSLLRRHRPRIVVSTGAGAALPILLAARVLRIEVVFIETFAHVTTPSLTGKWVSKWADHVFIQWPGLRRYYPQARLIETLRFAEQPPDSSPSERDLTLVTVGTHAPFEELLRQVELAVEEGILKGKVIAQTGDPARKSSVESFDYCSESELKDLLARSRLVITHAGTGSILSALEAGCKVIAIARKASRGEHYDDHQMEILEELRERGAILGSDRPSDLPDLLMQSPHFEPVATRYDPGLLREELGVLLDRL
jgi:UDP-N-acetylglucosamine transferase subunit ALG13